MQVAQDMVVKLQYELRNSEGELLEKTDEALEYLHTEKIDVIMLDLDLPDMNGFLLVDILQRNEQTRSIPIIIVSASDLRQTLHNQEQSLVGISLNRPFSQKELVNLLSSTLATLSPVYPEKYSPDSSQKNP